MNQTMVSKTIAVIGGAGFLGSHAADALTAAGHKVRVFDRIPSPWLQPGQEMIVGDLLDTDAIYKVVEDCQVVFHFAALADLNAARSRPVETARVNVLGTVQLLEACRLTCVERFVYASTMYVYSREGSFYRCSKQAAEEYVEEYQRSYGLEYTILRFGSLYGPRSDVNNGLYRVIKEALATGRIRYEGSPEAMREYVHVLDMAEACVKVLENEFAQKSIVLTGQEAMRVQDVLLMLAEILNLESSAVEFTGSEYAGHYIRTPYAYQSKIAKKYIPSMHVDLGRGLLNLIEYMKE